MAKGGATVWWVEAESGELRHWRFDSLPASGSYLAEAQTKYAADPIVMEVIHDDQKGSEWAKGVPAELAEKARQRKQRPERRLTDGLYDFVFTINGEIVLTCSSSIKVGHEFIFGDGTADCRGTLSVDGDTVKAQCTVLYIGPKPASEFPLGQNGAALSFSGAVIPSGDGFLAEGMLPDSGQRFTCVAQIRHRL